MTDLTKMVEDWKSKPHDVLSHLYQIIETMAAAIEANRKEIKSCTHEVVSLGYRIDTLLEVIEKLKIKVSKVHSHGIRM